MGPLSSKSKFAIAALAVGVIGAGSCAVFKSMQGPSLPPQFPEKLSLTLKGHATSQDPNIKFNGTDWSIFNSSLAKDVQHSESIVGGKFEYKKNSDVTSYASQALHFIFNNGFSAYFSGNQSRQMSESGAIKLATGSYEKALEAVTEERNKKKFPLQLLPSCVADSLKEIETAKVKYSKGDWQVLNFALASSLQSVEKGTPDTVPVLRDLFPTKGLSDSKLAAHLTNLIIAQSYYNQNGTPDALTQAFQYGEKCFADAQSKVGK